jgi:hypothetical protein
MYSIGGVRDEHLQHHWYGAILAIRRKLDQAVLWNVHIRMAYPNPKGTDPSELTERSRS